MGGINLITNSAVVGQLAVTGGFNTSPPTAGAGFGWSFGVGKSFTLDDVVQASEFTSLYDRYKINGVGIKVIPLSTEASYNGKGYVPTLFWCADYDDDQAPTTENAFRQKQYVKTRSLNKPVSFFIKPRVSASLLGAVGAGYGVSRAPFINCANTTVLHNGLKMWFKNVNLASSADIATQFNIETTYYLALKDPQ